MWNHDVQGNSTGRVNKMLGVTQQDSTEVVDILCQKCRGAATHVIRNARDEQLYEGWIDQYDSEAGEKVEGVMANWTRMCSKRS